MIKETEGSVKLGFNVLHAEIVDVYLYYSTHIKALVIRANIEILNRIFNMLRD